MTKKRILIVDDQRSNIDLLKDVLSDYDRMAAFSGKQALTAVNREPKPDLILLDVMMPDMDGYDVCQQIKANDETKHIPIIFVTAKDREEDETKGFAMGAVDYITKPISRPVVQARVKTHLQLRSAYQSLKENNDTLTQKESYIRSLIDQSLEIIVSLDADSNVVEFNQSAETAFGMSANEIRGTPMRGLFQNEIKFDFLQGLLFGKGSFTGELEMRHKEGKTFPAYLKFGLLRDVKGEIVGATGSLRDMSREKLLARMLQNKRDTDNTRKVLTTVNDQVRNGLNALMLLRTTADEKTSRDQESLDSFDQGIRMITQFLDKISNQ